MISNYCADSSQNVSIVLQEWLQKHKLKTTWMRFVLKNTSKASVITQNQAGVVVGGEHHDQVEIEAGATEHHG